nr:14867_t:CDS:2 [Entrophospora candida]
MKRFPDINTSSGMNSKKQRQSLDNLNLLDDENLQSWIEKFKLQYGLIIDEMGIKKGNIQPIQPFNSSTNLKINNINLTDSIKTNLTITNSLLHSYLLKNDIKVIDDEMIKFFDQEDLFINSKVKDSWNSESEQNIKDSWNLEFKRTIHYEISSQQIELTFENFVPSNKLIKDVHEALDTENPYHELEIIFNEYGHLLCKKIILGGKLSSSLHLDLNGGELSRSLHLDLNGGELSNSLNSDLNGGKLSRSLQLDLNENLFKERTIEKQIDPLSMNNNKELDEMLKEWDEIHRKVDYDFDLDNECFFNKNGHTTKRNLVIEWIKIMAEDSEFWDVIYYADLIPLYKILEESLQKEIELLFKDQILMIDSIKIEHKYTKYYRVDFKTPLKSDKYQIHGDIFNKNSEKCFDIIIKFKYFDQFDENQNDISHIRWAMVGSPAEIGFYSKNTRNLKMMNSEESSGTDLDYIFRMTSLNNSLSGGDKGKNVENTDEIVDEEDKGIIINLLLQSK